MLNSNPYVIMLYMTHIQEHSQQHCSMASRKQEQPQVPARVKQINKMRYSHTLSYVNELTQLHATILYLE